MLPNESQDSGSNQPQILLLTGLVVVLLAIIGLVVAYYAVTNDSQGQVISSQVNTNSPFSTVPTQHYTNSGFHYELDYPANWNVHNSRAGEAIFNSPQNEQGLKSCLEGCTDDVFIFVPETLTDPSDPDDYPTSAFENRINEIVRMYGEVQSFTIDDNPAVSYLEGGFGAYFTVVVLHKNLLYKLQFGESMEADNSRDVFLKSFHFTD